MIKPLKKSACYTSAACPVSHNMWLRFHAENANGTILSFMNRLFYSTHFSKQMKVGAVVVNCRRGGNTTTFDELNKYFTISSMLVASSTYWNQVHEFTADNVRKDLEGLQTMRNLARNKSFRHNH